MEDMKIIKCLEESGLLMKVTIKTTEKGGFLGLLGANLSGKKANRQRLYPSRWGEK